METARQFVSYIELDFTDEDGGNEWIKRPTWEEVEAALKVTYAAEAIFTMNMRTTPPDGSPIRRFEMWSLPGSYTMLGELTGVRSMAAKNRKDPVIVWTGTARTEPPRGNTTIAECVYDNRAITTDLSIAIAYFRTLYHTGDFTPEQWELLW